MIISKTVMSPCKGCEDRCIGCHTTCGDYAIYKQALENNRAKINAQNDEAAFRETVKRNLLKRYGKRRDK